MKTSASSRAGVCRSRARFRGSPGKEGDMVQGGMFLAWLLSLAFVLFAAAGSCAAQQSPTEFFESKVRPILANNCYACHTDSKMGGLRLDSRVALLEGGKSGPAIVTGQPDDSLLIRAVMQTDEKLKMPMAGPKL